MARIKKQQQQRTGQYNCLQKDKSNRKSYSSLVGIQIDGVTLQFSTKLNIVLSFDPTITLPDFYPIYLKFYIFRKNLHVNIYRNFIHDWNKPGSNQEVLQ